MVTCALAVTVGDPGGHLLPGLLRNREALRGVFMAGGASITDNTDASVVSFIHEDLGWAIARQPPDGQVGFHRRVAVELSLKSAAEAVLYSDLDHVLKWIESAPTEVAVVAAAEQADMVVVGRSSRAMSASPARLRETERIVNHIYRLLSGNEWDLMFAVRRLTRALAMDVVARCVENSVANDVEWPLFAAASGYSAAYFESDYLMYRTREDFDAAGDRHDSDPLRWISRVEMADLHVQAMKRYAAPAS